MECALCKKRLGKKGNSVKAVCNDCIELIANKAKESGADFECFADAVSVADCPDYVTFPEFNYVN